MPQHLQLVYSSVRGSARHNLAPLHVYFKENLKIQMGVPPLPVSPLPSFPFSLFSHPFPSFPPLTFHAPLRQLEGLARLVHGAL